MKWPLRDWVHVAVFGALWGVVEIGLGSYMHILFPSLTNTFFTGLILGGIGISVALIGRQFVPRTGAVFMIGVVTALLKLLSFGGIKLGPAVAILAESMLMEIGLLWYGGRARWSYALAGALAMAWNAVHPFVMLPLLFGRSLGQVYTKLARDGASFLSLEVRDAVLILVVLLVIRAVVGSVAGWLAWDLAKLVRERIGR